MSEISVWLPVITVILGGTGIVGRYFMARIKHLEDKVDALAASNLVLSTENAKLHAELAALREQFGLPERRAQRRRKADNPPPPDDDPPEESADGP